MSLPTDPDSDAPSGGRSRTPSNESPRRASSRAYFDAIGADWDHMREGFFPDRVRDRALDVAAVEAGRAAADLGAGTGFITEGLLARGVNVIAIDQSSVMLDALRGKFPTLDPRSTPGESRSTPVDPRSTRVEPRSTPDAARSAIPRSFTPHRATLDCRTGDAERLPIDDASVDYCLANMYLHHVVRPAVAIAEMARILRPGGIVVITDLDAHKHIFLRDEHHDRWMGFARDDIRAWVRNAGFADVRVDDLGERCRAVSTDGAYAAISIFIASGLKR